VPGHTISPYTAIHTFLFQVKTAEREHSEFAASRRGLRGASFFPRPLRQKPIEPSWHHPPPAKTIAPPKNSLSVAASFSAERRQPLKRHTAAFEQEPESLPIHSAWLGKAMVQIDGCTLAVPNGAIDLFLCDRPPNRLVAPLGGLALQTRLQRPKRDLITQQNANDQP
jgi:hypothetical protein